MLEHLKDKIIQEIIRLGKENRRLRMPALAVAALFLVAYHSVRNFFLGFRYHPVRQRILVGILILSLLAGQIGIINVLAESEAGTTETVEAAGDGEAGNTESRTISAFLELPGDIREQTVPAGTALEELTLPDTLEAVCVRNEHGEDTQGDSTEEVMPEEETDTEADTDTQETPGGEEGGQEETDTDAEETAGEKEGGKEETGTGTEETAGGEEGEQEETDTDAEETPGGEEGGQEETDTDTEETAGGEESGQEETDTDIEKPSDGEETDRSNKDGDTEETDGSRQDGTGQEAAEEFGNTEENIDTDEEEQDTQPEETAAEDTAAVETIMTENAGDAGDNGDSAPSNEEGNAEITQETYNVTMPEYQAENVHTHNVCGNSSHADCTHDEEIEFEPFPKDAFNLRGKSYYLTEDIELVSSWELGGRYRLFVQDGVTNICLNGFTIRKEGGQIIDINEINAQYAELNICDCKGGGKIENTSAVNGYACISVIDASTLNLYGGTVDGGVRGVGIEIENNSSGGIEQGGTANIYGGVIETNEGTAIWLSEPDTSLSVYGGEISSSEYYAISVNGDRSKVSICGGNVTGSAENYDTLAISGQGAHGTISGGSVISQKDTAASCFNGDLKITGGEVKSESSTSWTVFNADTLVVSGGTISCGGYYGIYNNYDGKATISDGEINSAGSAIYNTEGGEIKIEGGNISSENYSRNSGIYNYGTLIMTDGEITGKGFCVIENHGNADLKNGKIAGKGTYAIFNYSGGEVELSGVNIEADVSAIYNYGITEIISGNIKSSNIKSSNYFAVYNEGSLKASGGKITADYKLLWNKSNGIAEIDGGELISEAEDCVYNQGSLTVSGGNITGKGTYTIQNCKNADLKISGGTIEAGAYLLYNLPGGSASISGGKLTAGNTCVWNSGTLDISDGEITTEDGNPVVNNGTLSISGGSFGAKNSRDAKYIPNKGVLNLSGSPEFNNTSLWLRTNDNIRITGELAYSGPCAVYIDSAAPRILTSGWSTYMGEKKPSDYFKSPYSLCTVGESDGEALLRLFMITFNANGGTCETPNTSVNDDRKATLLPEAKRKNYTFDGWFTAAENGEKVTADTVFTADTTVYAHWTSCSHIWSDTYEKDNDQHWKVCTKCDGADVKTDHIWDGGTVTTPPTEAADGERTYTCMVCSATRTESIHTHTYSDKWTSDETHHWHECDCGEKSELANHISSDWIVQTPATTDLEGVQIKNCTICGIELDRSSIDKLPNSGSGGDSGNSDDNDGSDDNDDSDNNGGSTPEDNSNPDTPAVTPQPEGTPTPKPEGTPTPKPEGTPTPQPEGTPTPQSEGTPTPQPEGTPQPQPEGTPTPQSEGTPTPQPEGTPTLQPESGAVQTVQASITDGRIVVDDGTSSGDGSSAGSGDLADGGKIATGNVPGMADAGTTPETSTLLELGDGAVIVTVVCEEQKCTAGVADTAAVANAVLTSEQIQLVNGGETIEVRIDVKDISETVTGQDKEVIESGLTEYRKEIQELTLGMYVDISMFIRIGEGGWDAVTSTEEPIEVIIGIPEDLQEDGREFYIIRSHEGEYTLLNDMDDAPDTITISTDMFSAYAITFRQTDTDNAQGGNTKCRLCHICPTFLGICYFIWLAVIIAAILLIALIVMRKRKEKEQQS